LHFPKKLLLSYAMLTKRQKQAAIKDVQNHKEDTGSASAQAAILNKKIDELSKHLKKNPKDVHSRRGLLKMVADRMSNLKYLQKNDPKKHKEVTKSLGLKNK
jgi:small subunit ribosomal protein S15